MNYIRNLIQTCHSITVLVINGRVVSLYPARQISIFFSLFSLTER